MENLKTYIIGGVVLLAVGFGIGRYTVPEHLEEQTSTETDSKKEDTVIVREEKRPDGTVIKETTKTSKKEESKKEETIKIVENHKPNWKASALAGYNLEAGRPVYGAAVDRRILGNIFLGVWGTTDKQVGASVSLEF